MSEQQQDEGSVKSADDSNSSEIELRHYALRSAEFLLRKSSLPYDLAEDIGQRALLKYLQIGSERRSQIRNQNAYLHQIVRNEIANHLSETGDRFTEPLDVENTGDALRPISAGRVIEDQILLREVWDQLKGDDRRLFELLIFDYHGDELARRLGISKDAARQRTVRLFAKLRVLLTEGQNAKHKPSPLT